MGWRLTYNETVKIFTGMDRVFADSSPIPNFGFWVFKENPDRGHQWTRVAGGSYHNPETVQEGNFDRLNSTSFEAS